jgi:large subunit ribosomal protein L6
MSRIGEKPIDVPAGVTVTADAAQVCVAGKLGELRLALPAGIAAQAAEGKMSVSRLDDSRRARGCHGLTRTLIFNMIEGVSKGYKKELEIQGVGFKATVQGRKLLLSLGFASPVEYSLPDGIAVKVDDATRLTVSGCDKQGVGDVAARIRSFYRAEPYKGKGIRYRNERVRRKVGKTVA